MASSSSFLARLRPHPPAPPEQSASKAGRNLWKAIPTALLLLALVAACVVWRIELFVALACVALCVAVWEAAGAFLVKNIHVPYVFLILLTLVMVIGTWFWGVKVALLVFVVAYLFFYVRFLFSAEAKEEKEEIKLSLINDLVGYWGVFGTLMAAILASPVLLIYVGLHGRLSSKRAEVNLSSILILAWISLLGSFAAGLTTLDKAAWLVGLLILLPAANDTGGWLAGVLFGKHPMAPKISPKKSWEGLAGSFILSIAIALAILSLALKQPWWVGVLYGVLAVIASTGGDLLESLIKRRLGIKDMGALFPGHGGVLDRIDSILVWAPVCYVLSLIFLNS